MASIQGPIAPVSEKEADPRRSTLQVFIQGSTDHAAILEREWEGILTNVLSSCVCLEQYPRTLLSIAVHILAADGSLLSAILHAATAALMEAGVELRRVPVAVTVTKTEGEIMLDPSQKEEENEGGVLVVILDSSNCELLALHSDGNLAATNVSLFEYWELAEQAVPAITGFLRQTFAAKIQRESQTLWS